MTKKKEGTWPPVQPCCGKPHYVVEGVPCTNTNKGGKK